MAVYRIYPEADTFITSFISESNAGIDEIVELGGFPNRIIKGESSRILVKFKDTEVTSTLTNIVSSGFSASINYTLADATELPETLSINAWPLAESFTKGIGKIEDTPTDRSGVTWKHRNADRNNAWGTEQANATGSSSGSLAGGGLWYTGSNNIDLTTTTSHTYLDSKDIDINVTEAVKLQFSSSIANNGFILKLADNLDFNTTSSIKLKYFSQNTHTIYRPYLEFKWDDSSFITGSNSILATDKAVIGINNNSGEYGNKGKKRFRLTSKPQHPVRTFSTGSIYKTNYALPATSTYAIQDEFTKENIVDFDPTFTKISCDSEGSFFDLHLTNLEPERYYKVLISSSLDGSDVIIDNDNIFKVVKNG